MVAKKLTLPTFLSLLRQPVMKYKPVSSGSRLMSPEMESKGNVCKPGFKVHLRSHLRAFEPYYCKQISSCNVGKPVARVRNLET